MDTEEIQRKSAIEFFVEELSVLWEHSGLPRMAGRVYAWLLVCEPNHQSSAQLAEALKASRGSISSMTRLLAQSGLIERFSIPGDRSTYFRAKEGGLASVFQSKLFVITTMRQLAQKGLDLLIADGRDNASLQRLKDTRDLYAFMEEAFPKMMDDWEKFRESE